MQTYSNYRISLKKSFSRDTFTDFIELRKAAKKIRNIKTHQQTQQEQKQDQNRKSSLQSDTKTQKLLPTIKRASKQNKTFFFQSSDNYIKRQFDKNIFRILTQNEWTQSILDIYSNNLKWVTLTKPQHFHSLESNQLINHFKDSYKLTTKIGLFNLLTSPHNDTLTDQESRNYMKYFPRSYDLGADFQSFSRDFEHTAVLNLMKKLMIHIEILHQQSLFIKYKSIVEMKNRRKPLKDDQSMIKKLQYAINNQKGFFDHRPEDQRIKINGKLFVCLIRYFLELLQGNVNNFPLRQKQYLIEHSKLIPPFTNIHNALFLSHYGAILLFEIYYYCLSTYPYFLNDGLNNIWVVKLNESSRGRSIKLVDDIEAAKVFQKDDNKLIQKYVENVWILKDQENLIKNNKISKIFGRKFDLRFWVLVKSFLPLQAYIFEEGYLRLSSQNYKLEENSEALQKDIKKHLTNYSVNYGKKSKKSFKNQTGQNIFNSEKNDEDSYLLFSNFVSYVQKGNVKCSESILFKKIMKKIHHILMMASNGWRFSQTDKNSFELFGFDVILDCQLEPFILECNMSPACHERGQLKEIVQKMGFALLQIVGAFNPKNDETKARQGWIKLQRQKSEFQIVKNCKNLQENLFINNKNSKDFCVIGQNRDNKKLLNQDIYITFTEKLIYLQRFFKNRYLQKKNTKRHNNISRSCLFIENLSKIIKRNKIFWVKKFLKYTKKHIKRSQKHQRYQIQE